MSLRLPPLNALRAFEAAARRGGFAKAAEELNVTPAAVSHQVKALESHLGHALFLRRPRGLALTEAGRQLLPELSMGLAHFARGIGSLTGGGLAGSLTVTVLPSFATLWLVPRLKDFLRSYPEIELTVLAEWPGTDVGRPDVDMGITYGLGRYPGLWVQPLLREDIFPVCAPELLNQAPLRRFSDLRHHTLLHDIKTDPDEPTFTWRRWLRDAGVKSIDPESGVKFSNSVMLLSAAVRGQGVALGRAALVSDYLASGTLVRPLKASRPADYAYYMLATVASAQQPRVQAFQRWLEEQAEAEVTAAEM